LDKVVVALFDYFDPIEKEEEKIEEDTCTFTKITLPEIFDFLL
jgi:hypothetical protein